MNLWEFRPGDTIRTGDGAVAEVLSETEDGAWIKARYIEVEVAPSHSGAYRSLIADPAWYERAHESHREIVEACKAGDVDRAIAAQDEHRQSALDNIIALLNGPMP